MRSSKRNTKRLSLSRGDGQEARASASPPREVTRLAVEADRHGKESEMNRTRRHHRSGQSLVEFAVVALVMYLLLAAILTFGHALYVAQGLQGAADLAAREISRTPLSANIQSLDDDGEGGDALSQQVIRQRVYDAAYLVIDLDTFYAANPGGNIFVDMVPNWPLLNQQLAALMIVDRPVIGGEQRRLLRYPGASLARGTPLQNPFGGTYDPWVATDLTVGIPLINAAGSLQWVGVVEEIENGTSDPFNVLNPQTNGIVALRMNYPFQSASMSSFRHDQTEIDFPFEETVGRPNLADNSLNPPTTPDGTPIDQPLIVNPDSDEPLYSGTYGGDSGLGAQARSAKLFVPFVE